MIAYGVVENADWVFEREGLFTNSSRTAQELADRTVEFQREWERNSGYGTPEGRELGSGCFVERIGPEIEGWSACSEGPAAASADVVAQRGPGGIRRVQARACASTVAKSEKDEKCGYCVGMRLFDFALMHL